MCIGKCCIDCIFCIPDNAPIECGMKYTCINSKGKQHFTDQWDTPCIHFMEDKYAN